MPLNLDSVIRVSATSLPTGVSTERFGKALLLSVPFEVGPTTNVFNGANQTAAETALSTYAGTSANAGWLATLDADPSLYVTLTWPTVPTDSLRQHRVGGAFVDLPAVSQTATNAKYRRFQRYSTMEEVSAVYDPSDEVYKAASIYFSSSPYPQELFVGLWDAGGSETISAALDAIAAVNNEWKFLAVDNRIREASISDVSEAEVEASPLTTELGRPQFLMFRRLKLSPPQHGRGQTTNWRLLTAAARPRSPRPTPLLSPTS